MKRGGFLKSSPSPLSFLVIKEGTSILQTWSYPLAAGKTREALLCSPLGAILLLEIIGLLKVLFEQKQGCCSILGQNEGSLY